MILRLAMLVLLGCCPLLGGCQQTGYFLYLFAPVMPAKSVAAEYEGLAGHSVAVVVFADQQVQYEYPFARLTLSSAVAAELKAQFKDATVVDVRKVVRYQDENLYWETMDKTQLARALGADYVLLVCLTTYGTREPGSLNLYRGTIAAQPALFEASKPEPSCQVWKGQINVTYPPSEGGTPATDDRGIRQTAEKLFARQLVQKFYKHKPGGENET